MRPQNKILEDGEFYVYPHDERIEEIIKKTDKICDGYTCDDCPFSMGIMLSPNVSDEPTECVAVLLENLYSRYQYDRATKVWPESEVKE